MKYRNLHSWKVETSEAIAIQKQLKKRIKLRSFRKSPRWIAGGDVSFSRGSAYIFAAFVVLDLKDFSRVEVSTAKTKMSFPYIPGLLSFREIPVMLKAWKNLKQKPDVVLIDGHGIAHPRRLGIATHFGILTDIPTIGCAKSLLRGDFEEPAPKVGSESPLYESGEQVGVVLRSKARSNPIFISPAHLCTIKDAVRIVRSCITKYRIPEPTRQAHLLANEVRRKFTESISDRGAENPQFLK